MAEDIKAKLERYKTAPFDSRFPNQNQTKNCWQNYLGTAPRGGGGHPGISTAVRRPCGQGADAGPCQWYYRVYKSLCPTAWVTTWDEYREEGTFPGKI
ncbi:hypothetical protein QYF61_006871 [Mycteria americana]|uniref:Uncharacterized protein n=1 Tax=Mycteria americana TaxID=33587 RepID=A0AAN7MGY2_MYCAM|nr:hypothetical protein QYF61_006871 [Mycteria americana]